MPDIQTLFGIDSKEIKPTCVLTPFLSKGLVHFLGVEEMLRGNPFSCGQSEHFTLIHTQIGAPFVGDAVLYLEETACDRIFFIGACGIVQKTEKLKLGTLVAAKECHNYESFSHLLDGKIDTPPPAKPTEPLLAKAKELGFQEVTCASFGSFKLEDKYYTELQNKKIEVVEMECSALYKAATSIKRQALALMYVTDILQDKHVFEPMTEDHRQAVQKAQEDLCEKIHQLV